MILNHPEGIGNKFAFKKINLPEFGDVYTNNGHNIFLNEMLRFSIPVGVCFIILFALIAKGTSDPIIICPNLYQNSFTQEKRIVAKDIARGLYSDRIPLFPLWAKIENIKRDGTATISVHYGFIPCVIVHSFCDEGPLGINQSG